ncbi:MAG: alpha-amylase family glycosyl hydrolase [Oscillospiraceae bacterium]|nr:alpha-amylase family glycosyl hydrolase [Oscillospiraceae bacterium]
MAWYDEAVFYHIYPLGLTGAPKQNEYGEPVHRLNNLIPWIEHIKKTGFNAIYIGPLFESVGHGYETTDYRKLDSRLGTNEDLANFVAVCHEAGIKVIFDGVFNHTGRDFFAFKDLKEKREGSQYRDWFCNVNFGGNNEYNDGFSYDNWGGYNLLVKLNQKNPAVKDYICDVIRFWVSEFDVDGIRLDAADVLDFDFMKELRRTANEVKPDFWLMGEVIHGDYSRWVNGETLHSVTNYALHKALYSGHNDHNYFEIAHTVKRLYEMGGSRPDGLKLYNFTDNHDVERIINKLTNRANFIPVHILEYTLPGVPSVYYGSEFGIEGKKEKFSDDSLRPALALSDFADSYENNSCTKVISALGRIRANTPALSYGDYRELRLTNRQYAFSRVWNGTQVIVAVNNDENQASVTVSADHSEYTGMLSGRKISAGGGSLTVDIPGNSGDIWVPSESGAEAVPVEIKIPEPAPAKTEEKPAEPVKAAEPVKEEVQENVKTVTKPAESDSSSGKEKISSAADVPEKLNLNKPYEEMTVPELQACILEKLAKNGPVTDRMKKDVEENIYQNSLLNWVRSFR